MFDTRYYQDVEISRNLKRLRTHCHLSNEALKEALTVVRPPTQPDWGKVLSNLDVAAIQLELFERKMQESEDILQNIAVPLQDVRDGQRPGIPIILDSGQEQSTVDKTFERLEASPFGTMSNKAIDERRAKFNKMVDSMANESAEWRERIHTIMANKRKETQEELVVASEKTSTDGSSSTTSLGKRQRETMKEGLDAFSFMAAM